MLVGRGNPRLTAFAVLLALVVIPAASLLIANITRAGGGTVGTGVCQTTVSETSTVTVTQTAGRCIYTFTRGSTSFTPPTGTSMIKALLVGGGGGGGSNRGGGGGSGGFYEPNWYYTNGAITVDVGAGGAGGSAPTANVGVRGNNGGTSSLTFGGASFAAGGGGGGGAHAATGTDQSGKDGNVVPTGYTGPKGSGGGASMNFSGTGFNGGSLDAGLYGYGNQGGWSLSVQEPVRNTGGGGGAGGGGFSGQYGDCSASSGIKPDGGPGLASSITGSSVVYAAGGGGADARSLDEVCGGTAAGIKESAGAGAGGSGLGGAGAVAGGTPTNAVANTGSGGGGGNTGSSAGGNGSDGIVILSIDVTKPASTSSISTAYMAKNDASVQVDYTTTDTDSVASVKAYFAYTADLSSP
ncbi:MAG: hypothetical protein EBZ91_13505, partial [Gammaproteobacteria bacterium]|nr:hypothetical protein [Gammaproteobacteria bacterium]